jgi:hypothetical protein
LHEEYDGELIDLLMQVLNSDDLGNSEPDTAEEPGDMAGVMGRMGWYAASWYAANVLGGETLHYRRPDTAERPGAIRGNTSRDAWFGFIADRMAELIRGPLGMSEEFLVRSLRDDTRRWLAHVGDTAKWDDRVAAILSDDVIDRWRGRRPR